MKGERAELKGGKGGWGNWEAAGFQGEVHVKTLGLYQVSNWRFGKQTKMGDILTFSIFQISPLPKKFGLNVLQCGPNFFYNIR